MQIIRRNSAKILRFTPVDPTDEYTKKAGLTDVDFQKSIFRDKSVADLADYTLDPITEIGSSHEYVSQIVPKVNGQWEVEITWGAEKERFVDEFVVEEFVVGDIIRGVPL